MTAQQALAIAVKRLKAADVPDAANDARVLLAHAMGIARGRLMLVLQDEIEPATATKYDAMVGRRTQRQPVSHITGMREFYGRRFRVCSDVLDPRPETEILIETALSQSFEKVLDLGTGSGCILLTLLMENKLAAGHGADISDAALVIARQNATDMALQDRCQLIQSDWFSNIDGRFDLIVANPPYITANEMRYLPPEVRQWEPKIALTPGGDGLDAYRTIIATAPEYLVPNGRLIVEIGPTQSSEVRALFQNAGFSGITTVQDMDGRDRIVLGVTA